MPPPFVCNLIKCSWIILKRFAFFWDLVRIDLFPLWNPSTAWPLHSTFWFGGLGNTSMEMLNRHRLEQMEEPLSLNLLFFIRMIKPRIYKGKWNKMQNWIYFWCRIKVNMHASQEKSPDPNAKQPSAASPHLSAPVLPEPVQSVTTTTSQ